MCLVMAIVAAKRVVCFFLLDFALIISLESLKHKSFYVSLPTENRNNRPRPLNAKQAWRHPEQTHHSNLLLRFKQKACRSKMFFFSIFD